MPPFEGDKLVKEGRGITILTPNKLEKKSYKLKNEIRQISFVST